MTDAQLLLATIATLIAAAVITALVDRWATAKQRQLEREESESLTAMVNGDTRRGDVIELWPRVD